MGIQLRADFKSREAPMTMEALRGALDDLEAHAGVPHDARLKVTHYAQGGWEVVAHWTPDNKPAPVEAPPYLKDPEPVSVPVEVHPCYRCQAPIVADGTKKTGYRHQDEGDPDTHYAHAAVRFRPIGNNPQA